MKNLFYPIVLILIISSLLISCADDGTEILFSTTVNMLEQVSSGQQCSGRRYHLAYD